MTLGPCWLPDGPNKLATAIEARVVTVETTDRHAVARGFGFAALALTPAKAVLVLQSMLRQTAKQLRARAVELDDYADALSGRMRR